MWAREKEPKYQEENKDTHTHTHTRKDILGNKKTKSCWHLRKKLRKSLGPLEELWLHTRWFRVGRSRWPSACHSPGPHLRPAGCRRGRPDRGTARPGGPMVRANEAPRFPEGWTRMLRDQNGAPGRKVRLKVPTLAHGEKPRRHEARSILRQTTYQLLRNGMLSSLCRLAQCDGRPDDTNDDPRDTCQTVGPLLGWKWLDQTPSVIFAAPPVPGGQSTSRLNFRAFQGSKHVTKS